MYTEESLRISVEFDEKDNVQIISDSPEEVEII